jgi:hypothetical protein
MSHPLTAHDEPYSVVAGVHAPDLRSTTTVLSVEEKVAISPDPDVSHRGPTVVRNSRGALQPASTRYPSRRSRQLSSRHWRPS